MALVPPLTLIFTVLGSIIMGIATVNGGAIGAVGAMIMGQAYRRTKNSFYPAILAIISTVAIFVVLNYFELNIKNIKSTEEGIAMLIATLAVIGLLVAVFWSGWRTFRIEDTLKVMLETSKTTSMVFIILLGATMLTSAFRGLEEKNWLKIS